MNIKNIMIVLALFTTTGLAQQPALSCSSNSSNLTTSELLAQLDENKDASTLGMGYDQLLLALTYYNNKNSPLGGDVKPIKVKNAIDGFEAAVNKAGKQTKMATLLCQLENYKSTLK